MYFQQKTLKPNYKNKKLLTTCWKHEIKKINIFVVDACYLPSFNINVLINNIKILMVLWYKSSLHDSN